MSAGQGYGENNYDEPYNRFGLPSNSYSYRKKRPSESYREEKSSERNRGNNNIEIDYTKISQLIKQNNIEKMKNYFQYNIYSILNRIPNLREIINHFQRLIDFVLNTFMNESILIEPKIYLILNLSELLKILVGTNLIDLYQIQRRQVIDKYQSMFQILIQHKDSISPQLLDKGLDSIHYLINQLLAKDQVESIYKRVNKPLINGYMNLKKRQMIRKSNEIIRPNNMIKPFHRFLHDLFINVNYETSRNTRTRIPEESQRSIIYLFIEFFTNQMNEFLSYETRLQNSKLNHQILLKIKKYLNDLELTYYLPISYNLTNSNLRRYEQENINAIKRRVGERKGAQGFVNIHPEVGMAEKYLNLRIHPSTGLEPATFYNTKIGNTKEEYTRINNTIPARVFSEYIIHSYLYSVNPNYVSEIQGITFSRNVAQIHYQLIDGYNPLQLLNRYLDHKLKNQEESDLIDIIFHGSVRMETQRPIQNLTTVNEINSHLNSINFRIPEGIHYPNISRIYQLIFQALATYQRSASFVHSDFGWGNMMFDKTKIKPLPLPTGTSQFQDGFIKLVDFELSSINVAFDSTKPEEKTLIKRMDSQKSTIMRNFVQIESLNPLGIKIYDSVRFILDQIVFGIFVIHFDYKIPIEFKITILQNFGKHYKERFPQVQLNEKEILKRFSKLLKVYPKSLLNPGKILVKAISQNYKIRNYVFFGIIPRGMNELNVIERLSRYLNTKNPVYYNYENIILPPLSMRPDDILDGEFTYSELFTPEYLESCFSS